MIFASLVALTVAMPAGRVVELIDPAAPVVSIEAVVPLPELGPRDQAIVRVLSEVLAEGTDTYGKEQYRDLAARAGESCGAARCRTISSSRSAVLEPDVDAGIAMLHAILRHPKLPQEAIDLALQQLPMRHQSFWTGSLRPEVLSFSRIRRADVVEMYERLFRPETIVVAVGGPIQPGKAKAAWDKLSDGWTAPRARPLLTDLSLPVLIDHLDGPVSMLELRAPEFVGGDAAMPTRLLALIGLGTGKGAPLSRRARKARVELHAGRSHWPTPKGFAPVSMVALTDAEGIDAKAKEIRSELLEDVKAWTPADLARAQGMAQGIFVHGFPANPLFLRSASQPIDVDIEDRTFMAAYWTMKTGSPWDSSAMLQRMSTVALEDFRDAANQMLSSAMTRTYRVR